jgi:hypothetical protein
MSLLIENKLNHLLSSWRENAIVTTKWLLQQGYSNQLLKKYCDNGWISKVGQGAYTKFHFRASWVGAIYALIHDLQLPVHLGGPTALELQGMGHNITFNFEQGSFYLFNNSRTKRNLPRWFRENFQNHIYAQYHLFKHEQNLETQSIENLKLLVSSPEQAALELLALTPHAFDYEHAAHLIENLHFLRPELLQKLLQECTTIKVKRLFLYLAEKYQLPCFAHLKINQLDLGKGKRVIGLGGEYISTYQISVPKLAEESSFVC